MLHLLENTKDKERTFSAMQQEAEKESTFSWYGDYVFMLTDDRKKAELLNISISFSVVIFFTSNNVHD